MSPSVRKDSEPSLEQKYLLVGLICVSAPFLLAIPRLKWLGWVLTASTFIFLALQRHSSFKRHMLILVGALSLLGIVPINTKIDYVHMLTMGTILAGTILMPLIVTSKGFKEHVITFPFRLGRKWYRREIAYVLFAGCTSYLLLPFYLANTGSYLHWDAQLDPSHIIRLFIGTNALGIWDELFFVGICLALLRQHIPFLWANMAQAVLWTTFLYELGFRGWGPIVIFFFALSQGYIFKRSKSLLYIITVHLTIDFMLFLVLVHLHNPDHLRIFITSPF